MIEALLILATYTESLLNNENALDGHSDNLYWVLTLTARPTRRLSSKMKALLMVTLIAYIESSP